MRRLILVALSIVLLPRLVNAEEAGSSVAPAQTGTSFNDVVNFALDAGKDEVVFKDPSAKLIGYSPRKGITTRGGGVTPKNTPDGSARYCHVAVKKTRKGKRPECLILHWFKTYPEEKYSVEYVFRYSLEGKLEKAFRGTGKLTDKGEGVEGSAVNVKLKVKDFEVQQRAREMLDFWKQRTAAYLAKKRGQTSIGGGQSASAVQAPRDAVAEPATNKR